MCHSEKLSYSYTQQDIDSLPENEFSVMIETKGKSAITYIRRKGERVVKLPPNIAH